MNPLVRAAVIGFAQTLVVLLTVLAFVVFACMRASHTCCPCSEISKPMCPEVGVK